MTFAVVSAQLANTYQGYQKGVHMVVFLELKTGQWAAPVEMVDIMPEIFIEYETREIMPVEFVSDPNSDLQ